MDGIKIISIFLIILLIVVLTLFALKLITGLAFWITLGIVALIAYKGIPFMKKQRSY